MKQLPSSAWSGRLGHFRHDKLVFEHGNHAGAYGGRVDTQDVLCFEQQTLADTQHGLAESQSNQFSKQSTSVNAQSKLPSELDGLADKQSKLIADTKNLFIDTGRN